MPDYLVAMVLEEAHIKRQSLSTLKNYNARTFFSFFSDLSNAVDHQGQIDSVTEKEIC